MSGGTQKSNPMPLSEQYMVRRGCPEVASGPHGAHVGLQNPIPPAYMPASPCPLGGYHLAGRVSGAIHQPFAPHESIVRCYECKTSAVGVRGHSEIGSGIDTAGGI
jgi:hypothetical protein